VGAQWLSRCPYRRAALARKRERAGGGQLQASGTRRLNVRLEDWLGQPRQLLPLPRLAVGDLQVREPRGVGKNPLPTVRGFGRRIQAVGRRRAWTCQRAARPPGARHASGSRPGRSGPRARGAPDEHRRARLQPGENRLDLVDAARLGQQAASELQSRQR
jgi:hypothetical protein